MYLEIGRSNSKENIVATKEEIDSAFYEAWANEPFDRDITVIDDLTEYDISLNAEDYFSDGILTLIESVIDDAQTHCPEEITAMNIELYVESKGKLWNHNEID